MIIHHHYGTIAACLLLLNAILSSGQTEGVTSCKFRRGLASNNVTLCLEASCDWLPALEQDGIETGRCYPCSPQTTQARCEGTGICFWMDGRKELGGSDCTVCAGRTQEDCQDTGYCFWNLEEGVEGVCSKCPGYIDKDSCSNAGMYSCWAV